jgi:ribose transport system permease protein
MKRLRAIRELSTVAILIAEVLFFAWYLWPEAGRAHPFLNAENALLILKYSSIYGIAAVGAAVVIISGGIDLAPGAVIALASVMVGHFFVAQHWPLAPSLIAGLSIGVASGLLTSLLVVMVKLPPFIATLGVMGITRGVAFIITEGRYYDVRAGFRRDGSRSAFRSTGWRRSPCLPWRRVQVLMTRFQWGRAVFSIGGNETAACSRARSGSDLVYVISGLLASLAGGAGPVQGQVKPTLRRATSWISSPAVVGGASLARRRAR